MNMFKAEDYKIIRNRLGSTIANIIKKVDKIAEEGGKELEEHFDTKTTGEVDYKDENNVVHTLVTTESLNNPDSVEVQNAFKTILKENTLTEVTWSELKDLRDNAQLVPGTLYRITDYQCTTTQENTRSAGHQFDIVLLALSENKLAEEGWAMMNENDVYDVTFSDGVTKKCYLYFIEDTDCNLVLYEDIAKGMDLGYGIDDFVEFDNNNKTAEIGVPYNDDDYGDGFISIAEPNVQYNYFSNSNLSAWKVWYCLDNDTDRFAWAKQYEGLIVDQEIPYNRKPSGDFDYDGNHYYCWADDADNVILTLTENPQVGDMTYDGEGEEFETIYQIIPAGTGVIYRLIDEFNNDVAYDFKNVQYVRKMDSDNLYNPTNGTDKWVYTFSLSLDGVEDVQDFSLKIYGATDNDEAWGAFNNVIQRYSLGWDSEGTGKIATLNSIVLISSELNVRESCVNNIFDYQCFKITLGTNSAPINNTFKGTAYEIETIERCSRIFIINSSNIQVTYMDYSSIILCSYIFLADLQNSKLFCVREINNNPKSVVGSLSGILNSILRMTITQICTSIEFQESSNVNIDKHVEFVVINACSSVTLTSTQTTTASQRIKNINIKNVKSKTISHNTLNDTFVTTYIPQNSTTVEV